MFANEAVDLFQPPASVPQALTWQSRQSKYVQVFDGKQYWSKLDNYFFFGTRRLAIGSWSVSLLLADGGV